MENFNFTEFTQEEIQFIKKKQKSKQMVFAIIFKYYQQNYTFIDDLSQVSKSVITSIGEILNISPQINGISSRTNDNFIASIRYYFKSTIPTKEHYQFLKEWIQSEVLPKKHLTQYEVKQLANNCLKETNVEPIAEKSMMRLIRDAFNSYEKELFFSINKELSNEQEARLNGLLLPYKEGVSYLGWLNRNFSNPCLNAILSLIKQLEIIDELNIKSSVLQLLPRKRILDYADRFTRLSPSHLKKKLDDDRCSQLVFHCHIRREQIIDQIVDMFSRITHDIIHKSERRVVKKLIANITKVYGKEDILYNIAEVCLSNPDDSIRSQIYPIAGEEKLQNIINDYKKKGSKYQDILHQQVRSSYSKYYRRMVKPFLSNVLLKSNNKEHAPILEGIKLVKKYFESGKKYFPKEENIPVNCLKQKWQKRVIDKKNGRVKRICYEVYLLKQLSSSIKCREIWVNNSCKHGNPDEDIPMDFEIKKEFYYDKLSLPLDGDQFIASLKNQLTTSLKELNEDLMTNKKVKIRKKKGGRIVVTPLTAQPEGKNIAIIKRHLQKKWKTLNLIDLLKEVELKINFTKDFVSYGEKKYLGTRELSERILLAIYGFGTNIGLKHVCNGNSHISYQQLKHVKEYYLSAANLRNASNKLANRLFKDRDIAIWGNMPVAVAGDSTQFSAYFQNMMSEFHNRYGGRGVMIYWHVEKKSVCIYSQLKNVAGSEVPAMINGILKHCTEMSVEKSYVDTHGQSEVGFAFSHLLTFELMPRLANLNSQKLSRCTLSDYQEYVNLQPILTDVIDWKLIKEQYDQMVKYTVAMKDGYADAESILRRFTRNNLKHPTYLALSQLGKVIKTIFICNYLMHESIRQEIQGGLNVVELWNAVSKFIFYGRAGEISSNYQKIQLLSVLSLQLLQLAMVYVNTMMLQQIVKENNLIDKLTEEDKRGLTPLIYEHISPYGSFKLDMDKKLPYMQYNEAA